MALKTTKWLTMPWILNENLLQFSDWDAPVWESPKGPEMLITTLMSALAGVVSVCDTYQVEVDLQDLYTTLANKIRRCRTLNKRELEAEIIDIVGRTIEAGIHRRDVVEREILLRYRRDMEQVRAAGGGPEQQPMEVDQSINLADTWFELLQIRDRQEREERTKQTMQILARAEYREVYAIGHGKISMEWLEQSLRASFSARSFCETISSGHTGDTEEKVASSIPDVTDDIPGAKKAHLDAMSSQPCADTEAWSSYRAMCIDLFRLQRDDLFQPAADHHLT